MNRRDALKLAVTAAAASGFARGRTVFAARVPAPPAPAARSQAESLARFAGCPVSTADSAAPAARSFDALRTSWNGCWAAKPIAIAHPRTEHEIARIVLWCRREQLPMRVRSGGHSFIGDSLSDGVIVDMTALGSIQPAARPECARIGGGALLGPVESALYHTLGRRTCTLGSCDSVGLSGLLLGGGVGLMSREHGLTIDALESARLVLPDGEIVEVDAGRRPELFWAIRGGGASFGILTEVVLRTRPWRSLHSVTQHWPWQQAAQVFRHWAEWIETLPPGSSASLVWMTSGTRGSSDIRTIVRSDRGMDEAERIAASLQAAMPAEESRRKARSSRPPAESCEIRASGPRSTNASSFADGSVGEATASRLSEAMDLRLKGGRDFGDGTCMMICNALGGAVARVPSESTAFAHRSARFLAEFAAEWTIDTARTREANGSWVRSTAGAARAGLGSGSYANYADASLADWRRAYWGANLPRLEQIKAQVDPTRFLGGRQFV